MKDNYRIEEDDILDVENFEDKRQERPEREQLELRLQDYKLRKTNQKQLVINSNNDAEDEKCTDAKSGKHLPDDYDGQSANEQQLKRPPRVQVAEKFDRHNNHIKLEARKEKVKKQENQVNLSFCGCGFLGIYHVGVASCFHEYAPQLSMHKISGSSAGAIVAIAHICGNLQLAYATTDILRVAIDARSRALGPFHPAFDINATVREALERALPEDIHLKANGKLHVSLTRAYDGENVIINEFDSKEDVIQVILCSCFIPFWTGLVAPKYRGVTYIDGGFSNNLLTLDDKTVTVSPFAGEADICPQDDTFNLLQVNLSNTSFSVSPNNLYRLSHALLPPAPEELSDLCEQGFSDGIKFLQRMKLISCTKCIEIRSSLLVTTNGEDMEEAFTNLANSSTDPMVSTSGFSENDHIRLEQQEQKMIEIDGISDRRKSVVSTTSQFYISQQQQQPMPDEWISPSGSASSSDDNCDECVLIRQKALRDPRIPSQFSDRIRDACDTVNKSLSNWLYSHRPIKYLSYLAAPYYLPLDISLALIRRCWQGLPSIRSELANCVYELVEFLIAMLKRMNSRSTSTLLMQSATNWEEQAMEYEKEVVRLQKRKVSGGSGCSNGGVRATTTSSHKIQTTTRTVESSFSLKISSTTTLSSSASLASAASISAPAPSDHRSSTGNLSAGGELGGCNGSAKFRLTRCSSTNQLHSLEDTFDSIVEVNSNQEARIFAYYFRDAKNRLQVTEIFDCERAAELSGSTLSLAGSQLH